MTNKTINNKLLSLQAHQDKVREELKRELIVLGEHLDHVHRQLRYIVMIRKQRDMWLQDEANTLKRIHIIEWLCDNLLCTDFEDCLIED